MVNMGTVSSDVLLNAMHPEERQLTENVLKKLGISQPSDQTILALHSSTSKATLLAIDDKLGTSPLSPGQQIDAISRTQPKQGILGNSLYSNIADAMLKSTITTTQQAQLVAGLEKYGENYYVSDRPLTGEDAVRASETRSQEILNNKKAPAANQQPPATPSDLPAMNMRTVDPSILADAMPQDEKELTTTVLNKLGVTNPSNDAVSILHNSVSIAELQAINKQLGTTPLPPGQQIDAIRNTQSGEPNFWSTSIYTKFADALKHSDITTEQQAQLVAGLEKYGQNYYVSNRPRNGEEAVRASAEEAKKLLKTSSPATQQTLGANSVPPAPAPTASQTTATRTPAATTTTDPAPATAKSSPAKPATTTAPAASAPPPAAPAAGAPPSVSPEHQKALDGSMALFLSQLGITDETDRKLFAERFKDQAETIHTFEQRLRSFDGNGQTGSKVAEGQTLADGVAQHGGMLVNPQLLTETQLAAMHNAYQQTVGSDKDKTEKLDSAIQTGQQRAGMPPSMPWKKDFTPAQNRLTKIDGRAPIGQTPRPDRMPQARPGEGITYIGQTTPSPQGFVPAYQEPPLLAPTNPSQAATPVATNWNDGNHGFGDAGDRSWQGPTPSALPTARANSQPPARTAMAPVSNAAPPATQGRFPTGRRQHNTLPGRGTGNRPPQDPGSVYVTKKDGHKYWTVSIGGLLGGGDSSPE